MIVVSWDGHNELNDGVNCTAFFVQDYGLPNLEPQLAERHNAAPIISGVKYPTDYTLPILQIQVENIVDPEAVRRQLHQWFDGKNGRARPLVISDVGGGKEREIYAVPLSLVQIEGGGSYQFFVTLKPDGAYDPHYRYRSTTDVNDNWNVTASGQTRVINNAGEDDAYPVLQITPGSPKSSGYTYKRWVPIIWRSTSGVSQYLIDITDGGLNTASLVSAGKMRSDGRDLAVQVDGSIVRRRVGGMNTSSTKVWVPLSFSYIAPVTLASALGTGSVASIEVNEDITDYPAAGILMIGSEAIQYTSKINNKSQFVGITRGAHGTTAASHSAGGQVDCVQHSVYLLYGYASNLVYYDLTPPPVFDVILSTNEVWVYNTSFGLSYETRFGAWQHDVDQSAEYYAYPYSTLGAATLPKPLNSPWAALGIAYSNLGTAAGKASIVFENICGIDEVDITAGELYAWAADELNGWQLSHYGFVEGEAQLADTTAVPGTRASLLGWTQTIDLTGLTGVATRYSFSLKLTGYLGVPVSSGFASFAGIDTAYITLHSTTIPSVTLGSEQSNYNLSATITNTTTGEAITITFNMPLNETLEVDTDQGTVTYLLDGSSQGQAVRIVGAPRQFWLPLVPGDNTLRFDDTGTGQITVATAFRKRYYV
ncbi:MAG: hypothetical protein KC441_02410 [Anaerolineales bacterium]|nr:hypothetical protein [Anaerolineales bacterium]